MLRFILVYQKTGDPKQDRLKRLAAETADLAQNLPDGAAIGVAVRVAIEEKHH